MVREVRRWAGARESEVVLDPDAGRDGSAPRTLRALAYVDLVGEPVPGDRVLLNVNAQARGLGTGGLAMVVALPDRLPADPPPGPGHLVKARYTPLQTMVLGVDDQESPHHEALAHADDLGGLPVVVADLHSALPAVVAGMRLAAAEAGREEPRVAYVMTDGGALPMAFSRAVAGLREAGWLCGTISCGQAFGGDLEAVTVHTALLAAREVWHADAAVVAQGPGNLGTGTAWGFTGVAVGEALNAVAVLGGRPIACLRVSQADARPRHLGVSHHTLTALGRVALAPSEVAVPGLAGADGVPGGLAETVAAQLDTLPPRHRRVPVSSDGLLEALRRCPVRLSTMGRGLDEDTAAFLAAAAAGRLALTRE